MSTIYVLTDGIYSDYHIIGVFSSEEAGEKAKAEFGGDFEEYNLDELGKEGRLPYYVHMNLVRQETIVHVDNNPRPINEIREFTNYLPGINYQLYVMAEDREHAIKIASDLIAQHIAIGETK